MTAGVAVRLGIGYEDCKRVKPEIVYCNTWAYGLEGPLAHFGGLDPLYQASAGLEYEQGPVREGNAPNYLRFGMTDTANAMLSVVGCLAALYHQRVTGEGQELWTSLLDGGSMFASDALLVDGEAVPAAPARQGADRASTRCYRLYETQDGWIQIAAVEDARVGTRCAARSVRPSSRPIRASRRARRAPRTAGSSSRCSSRASRRAPRSVWTRALDAAGVPNEIAIDTKAGERVLFDADNERLGLVAEYDHPLLGRMRQYGTLHRLLGDARPDQRPAAARRRAHRRDPRVARLHRRPTWTSSRPNGVVYWPDDNYAWTV